MNELDVVGAPSRLHLSVHDALSQSWRWSDKELGIAGRSLSEMETVRNIEKK